MNPTWLVELTHRHGWQGQVAGVQEVPPGMSGCRVFRILFHAGNSVAVKWLPQSTDLDRVRECHRVMATARKNGCHFVPPIRFATSSSGQTYEIVDWIDATCLPVDAPLHAIMQGAGAIAQFHRSVSTLHASQDHSAGIAQRIRGLVRSGEALPELQQTEMIAKRFLAANHTDSSQTFASTFLTAVSLLKQALPSRSRILLSHLQPWADRKLPLQYVMRDVHREHILFDDADQESPIVAGLIDFDALQIDTPLLDFARWLSSFTDSAARRNLIWQTWATELSADSSGQTQFPNTLGDAIEQLELAKSIAEASVWLGLKNWVGWIAEARHFPCGTSVVTSRMQFLIRQAASFAD